MKYLTPPLNEARELLVQSDQNYGCERIRDRNDDMKNISSLTRVKLLSAFNFQVNNVGFDHHASIREAAAMSKLPTSALKPII